VKVRLRVVRECYSEAARSRGLADVRAASRFLVRSIVDVIASCATPRSVKNDLGVRDHPAPRGKRRVRPRHVYTTTALKIAQSSRGRSRDGLGDVCIGATNASRRYGIRISFVQDIFGIYFQRDRALRDRRRRSLLEIS